MNSKRILSLVLCLLLSFSCVAFADEAVSGDQTGDKADITDLYETAADVLYMHGLFKGGSNGFDLTGDSTKAQAAIMVVRLIGRRGRSPQRIFLTSFQRCSCMGF